jgi:hypothetical protein
MNLLNKKAAMFGLDARIALAIFGALSVISGAALFSAIQDSKATAILNEMQEVGKAWEQLYLDTGKSLDRRSADTAIHDHYVLKTMDFIEDPGTAGWKGPYMQLKDVGHENTAAFNDDTYTALGFFNDVIGTDTWGTNTTWCNDASDKCFLWSFRWFMPDDDMAIAIDKKIDKGDGSAAGNFRWEDYGAGLGWFYALKLTAIPNPYK